MADDQTEQEKDKEFQTELSLMKQRNKALAQIVDVEKVVTSILMVSDLSRQRE